MYQFFTEDFSGIPAQTLNWIALAVCILVAVLFLMILFRIIRGPKLGGGRRGRNARLAITDAANIGDDRRKLVLVRRDNVEHLLLIGGATDIVVESNIVRAVPQQQTGKAARVPPQAAAPVRREPAPLTQPPAAAPPPAPAKPVVVAPDPVASPIASPVPAPPPAPAPASGLVAGAIAATATVGAAATSLTAQQEAPAADAINTTAEPDTPPADTIEAPTRSGDSVKDMDALLEEISAEK